jgi:hypothetical protein
MVEPDVFPGDMPLEGTCSSSTSLHGVETEVVPDKSLPKKAYGGFSSISTGNGIASTDGVS